MHSRIARAAAAAQRTAVSYVALLRVTAAEVRPPLLVHTGSVSVHFRDSTIAPPIVRLRELR
eukprot:SAG25_NODE_219_length_11644_cov_21.713729_3_plen_62_part_00